MALKVLPSQMADNPVSLARFQCEARALAALNHQHIVTIFSVEEAEGVHFLTMELVEGRSLDRLIRPDGMPFAQIVEIAASIADALAAAHEKGIVHRDLKSASVMLCDDGRVKVLDFGLAKDLLRSTPTSDTMDSVDVRDAIPSLEKSKAMDAPAFASAWLAYAYGAFGDRARLGGIGKFKESLAPERSTVQPRNRVSGTGRSCACVGRAG